MVKPLNTKIIISNGKDSYKSSTFRLFLIFKVMNRVVQRRVLEFALFCNYWQTRLVDITVNQQINLPLPLQALGTVGTAYSLSSHLPF